MKKVFAIMSFLSFRLYRKISECQIWIKGFPEKYCYVLFDLGGKKSQCTAMINVQTVSRMYFKVVLYFRDNLYSPLWFFQRNKTIWLSRLNMNYYTVSLLSAFICHRCACPKVIWVNIHGVEWSREVNFVSSVMIWTCLQSYIPRLLRLSY